MKYVAFYLPQFHQIPENDAWWGYGFTDWTSTRSAKPLFKEHLQPRIPLNENYYDLSQSAAIRKQAEFAKKYSIDAFCIYHYWFSGKLLLQKPAESLLADRSIDIEFCLSWANEPWTRSWDGKNKDILQRQDYGDNRDWTDHFNYLLPFFKDSRYLKIDNHPVFLIYRTNNIPNIEEMIALWNEKAVSHGFSGLHIIETLNSFQKSPALDASSGCLEFEPMYTVKNDLPILTQLSRALRKLANRFDILDYDTVWNRILRRERTFRNKLRYLGAFVDWDNTPRKKNKALIITGGNPSKFEYYLSEQSRRSESKLIFINAWNEWAEGAFLEPDTIWAYRYLSAVKKVASKSTCNE